MAPARMAISSSASFSRIGRMYSGGCTPLRPRIDERALDVHAERAGHAGMRLARRGQRCSEHVRRVGDDCRQKAGHPLAPVSTAAILAIASTVGSALNRTPAPPLICQSMKPGARTPPPRSISSPPRGRSSNRRAANRAAVDNQRVIVEKPFAVEQTGASEHSHCLASLPARRRRPPSGSRRPRRRTAAVAAAERRRDRGRGGEPPRRRRPARLSPRPARHSADQRVDRKRGRAAIASAMGSALAAQRKTLGAKEP